MLSVATSEGRVLVTLDLDFADIRRHPPGAAAGIVVFKLHKQTVGLMHRVAKSAGDLLDREQVTGRLWVLDESRARIWPA